MECEENLPDLDLRMELDLRGMQPWIPVETVGERYPRLASELATLYGITFCDEPEAQLVGSYIRSDLFFNRGTEIADMSAGDHLSFLTSYMRLHGLTYDDLNPEVSRILQYDPTERSSFELARDYFSGEFAIAKQVVIDEMRRLAGQHSIPTPQQEEAVPADPGGMIIRGEGIDFPTCDPGEARAFRSRALRKVSGHYSVAASGTAGGGTPGNPAMRYQVNKCGRTEFSLRTDASRSSHRPLADGLAPTRPPRAKAGYSFACCILEAKYVGNRRYSLYQAKRDFLRSTNAENEALPRRLEGLGRAGRVILWENVRASQARQLGLYVGAMADPEIPYWMTVYICSQDQARDYFRRLSRFVRLRVKVCTSTARGGWNMREQWRV